MKLFLSSLAIPDQGHFNLEQNKEYVAFPKLFATDWDIPESEGNGSGAMVLAAKLKQSIEIRHGKGSVIFAKPAPDNCTDISGRVTKESKSHE